MSNLYSIKLLTPGVLGGGQQGLKLCWRHLWKPPNVSKFTFFLSWAEFCLLRKFGFWFIFCFNASIFGWFVPLLTLTEGLNWGWNAGAGLLGGPRAVHNELKNLLLYHFLKTKIKRFHNTIQYWCILFWKTHPTRCIIQKRYKQKWILFSGFLAHCAWSWSRWFWG